MPAQILAEVSGSITELKTNPTALVERGGGAPVVILNRNTPAFYCVPAATFEAMAEVLEDMELAKLARERLKDKDKAIRVNIDDL